MTTTARRTAAESRTLDVDRFEALGELAEEAKADVLAEMAGLFTDEAAAWLAEAASAALTGDVVALRRVAHSLKGACGTIGAERMLALAVELEDLAAVDRLSDAGAIVRALTQEFGTVSESLRPYVPDRRRED